MSDLLGTAEGAATPPHPRVGSLREPPWPLLVWAAMLGWFAVLFFLVREHFLEFKLQRYDLGNMVQAVWSTAEGRPLETTLATGDQAARLAAHVDPILVLFAPLWIVWPSPLSLAAVQIAACALGALPVFWLGRRHLDSESAAGLLTLAYLAYPWLAWTAIDAIHPVTLAIPLSLYAIWFLDSKQLWAFVFCAVLIAATGELMGAPIAILGLWYWLSRGRRRAGIAIACAGVVWTVICLKVIVPYFSGSESPFYSYFTAVGGSPEGVLRTVFTDPGAIATALGTGRDLVYLLALAVPLAGAFLLAPTLASVALPQLVANGLSSIEGTTDPSGHHVAGVIPFLIAASVLGLARVPSARRVAVTAAVLALSLGFSFALGPWPGMPAQRSPYGAPSADRVDALRDAVMLIPNEAPVAATTKAGSHLSARRYFYSVPVLRRAEWVIVDLRDRWLPLPPLDSDRPTWGREDPALLEAFRVRLETSSDWRKVFERSGVFVFRKVPS